MSEPEWVTNDVPPAVAARHMTMKDRERHSRWRAQFIEGRPQATEHYTTEQLEAMGLVGLYRRRSSTARPTAP